MVLAPPIADDGAAPPDWPRACDRCGRPLDAFVLELPMGLGSRTVAGECACEQQRRAREARERAQAAHRERVRALLRQSGIGRRHEVASFENFVTTPATAAVVGVCRAFVAAFPEGGRGLSLAGPAGTGKTHLAVAVTRALIDRGVSAIGFDGPSADPVDTTTFELHRVWLGAGRMIIENVANLDLLPGRAQVVVAPMKVRGANGAPARIFAFLPDE